MPCYRHSGKKDELVPAENADFAKKMLINAPVDFVLVDDMNHFVPWSHPYLIHDAILKMIETTSPSRKLYPAH